ncbi:hypothetical protein K493DRAFT_313653 [Basidiobolus meristosporus CBS 931.73]|uniref:Uncharacterized protein n=1 Tax=Basidiobolus meristosporus CBS 931.73 TaxID=1314790 RepID=A0A1Y1YK62_9FUNG|nr:hypothetical protein K493DRAFT_313653 [Basidiobolus meristosporus CBS 931.73]|eukprot:ORX98405.1 hypothetical protein K493DRAFT_313653 [Basidiobolus meristosporus CBS 931.73]
MNHERFLPRHYEKLILRIIFSLDQELVHSIPFLKRDSMANYTCALLNFLPAGSTSTDILLEPLKYLKSIADKTSNTYFVVDAVRGRLKKKALLVSEKSISRMMKSIATRVQMIHRERCLLVPYPRNKTLYLIYCRDLYGNNVSVHYPQFHSKCYATHEMIREAIFSKRVKFYKDNDQLFDLMGGSKMKVPSFEVIKRAIVSEELSMPTSYDLLVLQLMAIEYDQRSEKGVPRTSIPYEYVAACKRLFNESWVDAKIGRKFYRMLNGYRNNMGDGDIYDDTYNVFAFENDFSMAY